MLNSPGFDNKKIQKPRILLKLVLLLVVVYVGIATVFHFFRLREYNYSYRQEKWGELSAGILAQPVTDIAFNRKSTYYFDWHPVEIDQIDRSVLPLTLRSKKDKLANYTQDWSSRNFQQATGYVTETAAIKPKDYEGFWSVVYCSLEDKVCEQSNLLHQDPVKILVDGKLEIWGVSDSGDWIQLELIGYYDIKDRKDLLFV